MRYCRSPIHNKTRLLNQLVLAPLWDLHLEEFMKLTTNEEVILMKRSIAIHGCSQTEAKNLMQSADKGDAFASTKADAIAKTFAQLKSMQKAKKTEMRSDRESSSLLRVLSSKLSPYEEYIAQTKKPEFAKNESWIKAIFKRGKVTQIESIALLSNSCISVMKPLDPFDVERVHLGSDPQLIKGAGAFCKRFNLA